MIPTPVLDPGFTTPDMTEIFCLRSRIRAILRFEAALAEAEAEIGIVPGEVSEEIVAACSHDLAEPESIIAAGWETGTPMIPLLAEIRSRLSATASRWLHHGATSQDAIDTGLMLQAQTGLESLAAGVDRIADRLAHLADANRATVMIGRTFLQHAAPTTFGLRAAQWLEPMIRHLVALRTTASSLPVQLGGPVGNLNDLGPDGITVMERAAARLGLAAPAVPWHSDRTRVVEVVSLVDRVAGSAGKIGSDLALLAQTDVAEVEMRPGGSSSMPHKRNPIDAIRAVAAAAACAGSSRSVSVATGQELERGIGGWQVEWLIVPTVFHTGAAAIEAIATALDSLEIDADRMAARVGSDDGAVVAAGSALIDRVLAQFGVARRPAPRH